MRTLTITALVACLFASTAYAQWERLHPTTGIELAQTAPDLDEDGCVALAERMDAKLRAKQQPSAEEQQSFAECIGWFNCDELGAAARAGNVPESAVATNAKAMRYTLRTCGNTSEAAKEPEPAKKEPEPQQPPAGSVFMREQPKSAFPR